MFKNKYLSLPPNWSLSLARSEFKFETKPYSHRMGVRRLRSKKRECFLII